MARKRTIRNCNDSYRINQLSVYAERFFYRLMMEVDDFGCYTANVRLIRSALFPFSPEDIPVEDVSKWLSELANVTNEKGIVSGLINLYEVDGKEYLEILDFGQRVDRATRKFPQNPNIGNIPGSSGKFRAEVEREVERKDIKKTHVREENNPPPQQSFISTSTDKPSLFFFWIREDFISMKPSEFLTTKDRLTHEQQLMTAFSGQTDAMIRASYYEFDKRCGTRFEDISHFRNAYRQDFDKLIKISKVKEQPRSAGAPVIPK